MIHIGIIGLSPDWETHYLPAIGRLSQRITISAIYDHVTNRAAQIANSLPSATTADGVIAVIERRSIDAVLLLNTAWHRQALISFICGRGKPAYLAGDLQADHALWEHLHATAILSGTMLMPEFRWRYTPATGRLQELIATQLGSPERLEIAIPSAHWETASGICDQLLDSVDWCGYISRRPLQRVHAPQSSSDPSIVLEFGQAGDPVVTAEIHRAREDRTTPRFTVHCRGGRAVLDGAEHLRWQVEGTEVGENLAADRSSVEVLLDHFCRRVVGGLIPVADLGDVHRNLTAIAAIRISSESGQPVSLPDA